MSLTPSECRVVDHIPEDVERGKYVQLLVVPENKRASLPLISDLELETQIVETVVQLSIKQVHKRAAPTFPEIMVESEFVPPAFIKYEMAVALSDRTASVFPRRSASKT